MKLPDSKRDKLKIPLGTLIPDDKVNRHNISKHLSPNTYLITVGDKTTEKIIQFGITPSLQIIDGQEKRKKRPVPPTTAIQLTVDNPPAHITPQSITTIKKAFTIPQPVRILVNGEEDLLVLPVCLYAPDNAIILYGQPNEGLVITILTPEIRNKVQTLLDLME